MPVLLQMDFPYSGPFGDRMAEALAGLAHAIAGEPGCIWKIWTENEAEKRAGGIYLFQDAETAAAYLKKHTVRLAAYGITGIRAGLFSVNAPLSKINHAPESCFL